MKPKDIIDKYLSSPKLGKNWMEDMANEIFECGKKEGISNSLNKIPLPIYYVPRGYGKFIEEQDALDWMYKVYHSVRKLRDGY
jgi:hypothetical protein